MTDDRSARAPIGYLLVRAACLVACRLLFDVRVEGRANLPGPGSIIAGVPHRNWVEPVLLAALLPADRRVVGVADGPTISRSRLRRTLIKAIGGAIPVWPKSGSRGFEMIATMAAYVLRRGGLLAIFPERGGPARAPTLRRISPGFAHIAARTGAPVIPIVFGGTDDLYLRRRIVVRMLPALDPPEDTRRSATHDWMARFEEIAIRAAAEVHEVAAPNAPRWKVGRWLTGRYPRAD